MSGVSQTEWTAEGSDAEDVAAIIAHLTRIAWRDHRHGGEVTVVMMTDSIIGALCSFLKLQYTQVAADARVYAGQVHHGAPPRREA
ncbi:MAG TPA: hypothetical protein VMV99_00575 [Rhodanobacter sp.]|nr:hypothetical protein [Rhodanobacter sp.]